MDDLFGKDDSGNDSDQIDIDEKDDHFNSFESKPEPKDPSNEVGMEISSQAIKTELDTSSTKSNSDHENTGSEVGDKPQESGSNLDLVKQEVGTNGREEMEHSNRDRIFDNVIVLPHSGPMTLKDRRESKEKSKRELEEEEREKMQVLVSNFTEDQLDRYEMYRRAAFPKAAIKRIMQTTTGCSVSQNVVIAMSGIAKVFVGEIVEEALDVMEANNESGPLQPKHLREAVRRLRLQGQMPKGRAHKSFFRL
ncbi:transcription initiation factor TFIID subunit 11 [Venturia canescens]|uniref:transcription initiation factor TFIID subunit 11 n=1 Tax=Venturia canescens TaxID=32260 RepID=UPI001C9D0FB2|nr:transcription initiation factor TFIID subunit 11 [Venturia canescens]XP_043277180.1 transcription initiation factor TFIID subunit 11 [Venturia canescens]XP_043277181.1 transcription initiation factor TFIID subunit 11 [Venturia canescens]